MTGKLFTAFLIIFAIITTAGIYVKLFSSNNRKSYISIQNCSVSKSNINKKINLSCRLINYKNPQTIIVSTLVMTPYDLPIELKPKKIHIKGTAYVNWSYSDDEKGKYYFIIRVYDKYQKKLINIKNTSSFEVK